MPPARFSAPVQKTRTLRNEISAYRSIARPHRCPFASKTHCGSHATHARLPAAPTAALRTAGAAPLSFLACGPARAELRAAPRARGPRAAHHEPGARESESVAASVQFSRRPSTRERPPSTPSCSEGRRIDGVRVASMAYGAHTRVTNAGARSSSASGNVENTRRGKKRRKRTT